MKFWKLFRKIFRESIKIATSGTPEEKNIAKQTLENGKRTGLMNVLTPLEKRKRKGTEVENLRVENI